MTYIRKVIGVIPPCPCPNGEGSDSSTEQVSEAVAQATHSLQRELTNLGEGNTKKFGSKLKRKVIGKTYDGPKGSNTPPKIDADTPVVGTENAFARGDHQHPHDTTKADVTALESEKQRAQLKEQLLQQNINTESQRAQEAEQQLRALYQALTETETIPVSELPATGEANKIYRVAGDGNYSDYMWNGTEWVLMATYDNDIDDEPTPGSHNLVESGGVAGMYGHYTDNPEFVRAVTDKDDKVLYGVQADGNFYFGAGCPQQVKDYIQHEIDTIMGVGDVTEKIDTINEMIAFFDKISHDENLKSLLDALDAKKVDKEEGKSLINKDYAEGITYIESPEFVEVKLDKDDRILEASILDGTKLLPAGYEVGGNVVKTISNPEYLAAWLDSSNHILFALKADGDVIFGCGIPSQIKEQVSVLVEMFHYKDNPEFIAVTLDSKNKIVWGIKADGTFCVVDIDFLDPSNKIKDILNHFDIKDDSEFLSVELDENEKVLGGRKSDGTKFENVGLDIGGSVLKGMNDPEGRMEVKTDSDEKIISYRKKDGTLVENIGIETNHLELTSQGMTDFQQALKDSGFIINVPGDWSDKESVELPEPKHYGMLNLIIDSLPKGGTSEGFVEYYDFAGNYFKKSCSLEPQGQSSSRFANTGGKGNYTLDITDDSEIKFGSWVPQDSFHLKGNYRDVTRGILPTAYKLAYILMNYLEAKPNRVMLKDDDIAVNHASGNKFTDWYDDARCLPDGFPVEVYLNGEYYGLFSLQLKKHRKNYSMDKKDYTSLFLDADAMMSDNYQHGLWNEGPDNWWTLIDIKGPKDLICMDGSKFDGDHPKELIDETSEVYDASNKAHKGSRQSKNIIRGFSTKYLEVKALIDSNNVPEAKTKFNENFDYNACMLVYIFNCLMNNGDSVKKNTLWATYKNGKVAPMLWDLDGLYGLSTFGNSIGNPSAGQWTGDYATSAWPLALFWDLYEPEIKATYAELRQNGIINMNTWKNVMYDQWTNRIGASAYERDIKKWSETPSYRDNYTNTEYWQEIGIQYVSGESTLWNANTSYSTGNTVTLRTYPTERAVYMVYKAIQPSTGVCPVTKFYEKFPVVGGCYDSPKRMEKWMTRQIELCDQVLGYTE